MFNHLKSFIALIWAKKHLRAVAKTKENAVQDQENLLKSLVSASAKTLFGRTHNFEEIQTVRDFQQRVPVQDYEDLKPYIQRIRRGQANILFPGTPAYFAKTSGTTSGAKYIPLTAQGMDHQVQAAQSALFHYIARKGNASFVSGKMIFLQGSPELAEEFGIKTGRLSGIVAHHIPKYLQKNRLPSWETNTIEDWEAKVDAIVRETEKENMTLISGIPPWLIMYFEKLQARHGQPITQIFPNLQLIITGGVNYEPYREKMCQLLGGAVDIVQTFPASEGFFAFQDDYTRPDLLLLTAHGIFYEFIPLEDFGKPGAARLTLGEVEKDQDYALILTTESGLWAYAIGDVVRFTSLAPYRLLVTGRTKHFTSAFGEHVIGIEAERALQQALGTFPVKVNEFHLAPLVSPAAGLPRHQWFVEFETMPEDLPAFTQNLDDALRGQNAYYDDLRAGNVLQILEIVALKKGAFTDFARENGKLGGQNKLPRLANDRQMAEALMKFRVGEAPQG